MAYGDNISRQAAIDGKISIQRANGAEIYFDEVVPVEYLKALSSAQPEQTNCDYCNEDADGYVKPIEKNGHAFVRFGMNGWELSLKANGWHGSAKIRYCPMCGRDLLVK